MARKPLTPKDRKLILSLQAKGETGTSIWRGHFPERELKEIYAVIHDAQKLPAQGAIQSIKISCQKILEAKSQDEIASKVEKIIHASDVLFDVVTKNRKVLRQVAEAHSSLSEILEVKVKPKKKPLR